MRRPSRRRILVMLRRVLRSDQLVLLVLAALTGTAAGYAAIGFHALYRVVQRLGFGGFEGDLALRVAELAPWQVVAVPTIGGLAIGLFVWRIMPGRRPHGVADVIESAALRSGRLGLRSGLGGALVSAASIGVGASVGREGPVVHIGATISALVAERVGLSRSQAITFLGCGTAAAIAASFNAPIAGVFFSLEVVIGHYALSAFAPIVIASVVGTIVSRVHFGNFPAFVVPEHSIVSFLEFPAFAGLGLVSALAAVVLLRSIILVDRAAAATKLPVWLRPMAAGLCVGLIALAFPQVLGVGYGTTDAALNGSLSLALLIAIVVAKMAATAISLGGGFGGGIFSPALFVGAMVGGAYGIIATDLVPQYSSDPTAYTLIGMGAVAGAVLGAPISTILIVFELTADYTLTIAVMLAVVIASVVTDHTRHRSFFDWQLVQRGLNLSSGREIGILHSVRLADLMKDDYVAVAPAASLREVRHALRRTPYGELFVVQDDGMLLGTITLSELSDEAFDPTLEPLINAGDVARRHPPVLAPDDDVGRALALMDDTGEEHIGVVASHRTQRLVGVVHQVQLMQAYNRALLQARREERGEA
jgi:chloride channel protein, CIC family